MAPRLLQRTYGDCVVLANLPGQRRVPYLPQEKISALRDARVRQMVKHAAETVPYYQQLFRERQLDPRDIRTASDLDQLPLLDTTQVREDPALFASSARWTKHSLLCQTRGSTDVPVSICHDARSLLENIAFGERERDVLTRFCGKEHGYRELYLGMPDWTLDRVWKFYSRWTWLPRPRRRVLSVAESVERIVEGINRFQPEVIIGIGSYCELLFKTVAARGLRMHRPRVVLYAGDAMTPAGKEFIECECKIPVLTQYNACECFKIGFSCEERNKIHIHDDLCYLRVVDDDGRTLPLGQSGEVVISNLVNRATVLLNYRLGDVAFISSEPCSCGRNFSSISGLEGRVWDIIHLPNGEWLHPRLIFQAFKYAQDVLRFQLVQHDAARFELKILTKDRQTYELQIGGIVAQLRAILGESPRIEPRFAEELGQVTGKFRTVVSHYHPVEALGQASVDH
jgi:phenylacetate-CoA ligase